MKKAAIELARAFGYLTEGEVDLIYTLANNITSDKPVIVNIGAGAGTSALSMALGKPSALLFSVDISKGGPLGGMSGERNSFKNAGINPPKQIIGKSHNVASEWKGPKIDLLFIDDGHVEDDVRGDISGWLPHMKIGGVMAFHDYGSERWPDVKRVVDELMAKYEEVAHVDHVIAFRVQ